jgi:hypothetical protein
VERKAVAEQERVRLVAKQTDRIARTKQEELFLANTVQRIPGFETEQRLQLREAEKWLRELLQQKGQVLYETAQATVLEMALVWEGHLKALVMEMKNAGEISIVGMGARERTPKAGHILVLKTPNT